MIISKTPYRISFFGGGTDYPAWYRRAGGEVLSTTIDKYCYVTCRPLPPFFANRHRIVWSHIETVDSIAEILHPAVREGLRMLGFNDSRGLEIHHQGDLPARAGIGSSASFAVGLILALSRLRGERLQPHDLALKAIELEQERLHENVGSQDQVAAAYGGLNHIRFRPSGDIQIDPVAIDEDRIRALESRLLLIFTGTSRLASRVAGTVIANLDRKEAEIRKIGAMVGEAISILRSGDLDDFGRLLHEAWMHKRELSNEISNPRIDGIYDLALAKGGLGGKLLGAGSSGFMVFYVPPESRRRVEKALGHCLQVPFRFETRGSHLAHDDPAG